MNMYKLQILLLKFHPFHQINKTRFGSEVVPFRFDFQKRHFWVALFISFFQPFESVFSRISKAL